MYLLKAQIVQDGIRREEEHRRRVEDRKEKQDELEEERARRHAKAQRQDVMLQMMMNLFYNGNEKNYPLANDHFLQF